MKPSLSKAGIFPIHIKATSSSSSSPFLLLLTPTHLTSLIATRASPSSSLQSCINHGHYDYYSNIFASSFGPKNGLSSTGQAPFLTYRNPPAFASLIPSSFTLASRWNQLPLSDLQRPSTQHHPSSSQSSNGHQYDDASSSILQWSLRTPSRSFLSTRFKDFRSKPRAFYSLLFSSSPAFCRFDFHRFLDPSKELNKDAFIFPQSSNEGPTSPTIVRPNVQYTVSMPNIGKQTTPSQASVEHASIQKPLASTNSDAPIESEETDSTATPRSTFSSSTSTTSIEDEEFPFSCPLTASVRTFSPEKKPWWKVVIAGFALFFFIAVWVISAFFPIYLTYWTYIQSRDLYRYKMEPTVKFDVPPLLEFFRRLDQAARDLTSFTIRTIQSIPSFFSSIRTLKISDVSTYFQSLYHASILTGADILRCMDWKGHICVAYLTSIVVINIRDFFKGPSQLPPFVKTADNVDISALERFRLKMMHTTLDWFLPGSAVIFEDYRSFVSSGRFNNPPTLMCYHPHGIISLGMFHLLSLPELDGYRIMGAPVLKYLCPLFRLMFSKAYVTLGSADRVSFIQSMKDRESLILVPGGVQEATITDYGKEQLYIKNRRGFIRYSLQYGYSVTPVYAFGENICYSHLLSNILHDIKFWLNSKGIPTVLPFGSLYWPFGLLPYRVPTLIVVGPPMQLPRIDKPTREDIDMYHQKYISEVRRLYVTYADSYYRYCKNKYKITVPNPTPEDNNRAIAFLPDAPPLQIW